MALKIVLQAKFKRSRNLGVIQEDEEEEEEEEEEAPFLYDIRSFIRTKPHTGNNKLTECSSSAPN